MSILSNADLSGQRVDGVPSGSVPTGFLVAACADQRLTLQGYRVLLALAGAGALGVWVSPKRKVISAACCDMDLGDVTKTTRRLVDLGWLEKRIEKVGGGPCEYRVRVPEVRS